MDETHLRYFFLVYIAKDFFSFSSDKLYNRVERGELINNLNITYPKIS